MMYVAGCACVLSVHHFVQWWDQFNRQKLREAKYSDRLHQTERTLDNAFTLYLRPFSTGGRLLTANPQYQPFLGTHRFFYERPWLELEEWLSNALVVDSPLIALGAPDARRGAILVSSTDDNWFETIKTAVKSATRVLVVPLAGEEEAGKGMEKEMEFLMTDRLRMRALFIMPPSEEPRWPIPIKPLPRQAIPLREAWAKAQEFWRSRNVQLPDYDPAGRIFFLSLDGTVAESQPLNLSQPTDFLETVMMMGASQIGHLFKDNAAKRSNAIEGESGSDASG